ncbi:MAG: metallophosphoesterase, partial [Dethiobacteria bacterium]|nr:metallophosphoesterase [Dethiobacteria bacterium]
ALAILALVIIKSNRPKSRFCYPLNALHSGPAAEYPDLNIAIISDTHYYDRKLGDSGPAFEAYLLTDRKLLKESVQLIELAIDEILLSDAEVVLIPGDLSCEGELLSHQGMANALSRLRDKGIRVFVIPGNHDIKMLHGAVSYRGVDTEPTESISAEQFAQIYNDFGYREALYRDDQSLSYVAPLNDNFWLVAIDTCRYRENTAVLDQVGSRLTQSLIDWLTTILKTAAAQDIAVMAMIHHGIVEHWSGQGKLHPDYLVEDYSHFNRFLAQAGVRLAFSGHYHSQDISLADYGKDGFIYDIETGSLITPPCPLRYATLKGNKLEIRSVNLIEKLYPGSNFAEEAEAFVLETLEYEIANTLRKYLVNDWDAQLLAEHVAAAFAAHSLGDENPALKPAFDSGQLSLWGRIIYARQKIVIDKLWINLPPSDLN